MKLSVKSKNISESNTLAITAKAKELRASGIDVVSFAAGEPDFNTPKNIIEAAKKAMENGNTKYTQTSGIIELRKTICDKLKNENGLTYEDSQIVVSSGAKQSLANIFLAILDKDDEVLLSVPYWVSYPELIKLADGVPVFVDTSIKNNFKFTVEHLNKALTEKTKAIVINNPNNPTGSIYTREELLEIVKFAKLHDIIIIADEIYERLVYDNKKHISIASLGEDAYNRTVVVNGFSKTYAMTGWRVGYTASCKELAKAMTNIQSHMTSNACSISQYAALEGLVGPQDDINSMIREFEYRRNFMYKKLSKIDGIEIIKPEGAFYIMVNIEKFIGKSFKGEKINNSLEFSSVLLKEKYVAVIPGSAFGLENYIRLSYATSIELINKGLERVNEFIKNLV